MPEATEQQVQNWANSRTRVRCESARNFKAAMKDDNASIGDIFEHCTGSATWTDQRQDGPPSLLGCNDILAINTFQDQLVKILENDFANDAERIAAVNAVAAQWPIVEKACVRALLDQGL